MVSLRIRWDVIH